jgi:hypothetical protein
MTRRLPSKRLRARLAARRERSRQLRTGVVAADLDQARKLTGSDWKTAQRLGLTPQHLSNYRNGHRQLTPAAAIKLANLLKKPLFPAVAIALAYTAKSRKHRELWLDVACGRWPGRGEIFEFWATQRFTTQYPKR